jgi:TetR/AcrR family macrolide resistance operon transcriptional repressor
MARPFIATDDDILLAARNVMTKRGPDAFSIAEVASEVGLSRAAIILRFKSTHALKIASLQKMVQQFEERLQTLPQTPSGDNLVRVAAFIGSHTHGRENSLRFFSNYYSSSVRDNELLELERKRGQALDTAISRVMPKNALTRQSAVLAFRAHLSGSIMAWLALENVGPRQYLVERTREWLKLAGIAFDERTIEQVLAEQPVNTSAETATPLRSKGTRSGKRPVRRAKATNARR